MNHCTRSARSTMVSALLLAAAVSAALPGPSRAQSPATPGPLEVVLLGTAAGPTPRVDRSQPANLLRVNGQPYLIDAGDNVSQQLARAGVVATAVNTAFITHLHFDHTLGLGSLMAFGWQSGRTQPMPIWGPPGTAEFVTREASGLDISAEIFRPQLSPRAQFADIYPVHEINVDAPVEVFRDEHVRVSATLNTHYDSASQVERSYGFDKSYSYRFDTAHGSVVFTGDTGPSENLALMASGADILVAEILDLPSLSDLLRRKFGDVNIEPMIAHMRHDHLSAADVGRLAQTAGVKMVILTHFSMGASFDPETFVAQVREFYPVGDIVVGRDVGVYRLPPRS